MRTTTVWEKIGSSVINIIIVFVIFLPFYFFIDDYVMQKVVFITLFFVYTMIFFFSNHNRCIGMMIMHVYYAGSYDFWKHFFYNIFYTMSFATIFFWIFVPFDLLIFNLLFLQLPVILIKKTTLHGYIAGDIVTVKRDAKFL